ncbi:cell division protein FtsL [Microbulbifer thermotolerans]|uniref:cell division protein FtsL n=1 Tax=Microbulbifer thermotolerans TaxID=252514 RepID=UPI002248DC57|nr:cell division protein FtsL [Microbulbifer thermotolerans]MCX2830088.1 cell division protein FtsL [Microbulbifer thermotolerans]MCX2841557.1 cell division protein FtsL [Microbulbifer thermotolerans]
MKGGKHLVVVLWLVTIVSALAVVYSTQRSRELTAQLMQAQKARDELRYEQERLLLEKSAWSAYSRIERVAREELKMRVPSPAERVLVPAEHN